jgi:asparagine synthase (glutamine-hydrolysing)
LIFKIASWLIKKTGIKNNTLIRGSRSLSFTDAIDRIYNAYTIFDSKEIFLLTGSEEFSAKKYIEYFYNLLDCHQISNSTDRMMLIDMFLRLADDLLLYTDKITMNFSLECRVPMLDLELVEFLQRIPLNYKVKFNKSKLIHKEYSRKFLPEKIISRKKLGFQSPTNEWFRENYDVVKEVLISSDNKLFNYINKSEIDKIMKDHLAGHNNEKKIFLLLTLSYWMNNI